MNLRLLAASLSSFLAGAGRAMAEVSAIFSKAEQPDVLNTACIMAKGTVGTSICLASDLWKFSNGNGLPAFRIAGKGPIEDINGLLASKAGFGAYAASAGLGKFRDVSPWQGDAIEDYPNLPQRPMFPANCRSQSTGLLQTLHFVLSRVRRASAAATVRFA